MRFGRISKTLAVTALVAVLAACTTPTPEPVGPTASASNSAGGTVTVLEQSPLTSFNPESVTGKTATNVRIASATHSGFNSVDSSLKIVKNESFGSYKKVSDDPLEIKYTINKDVKWSDGEPVKAADLLLQWAAASGYYNDATLDADFKVTKGTAYFHSAADPTGLNNTELPVIGDEGASLTLKYTKPFSDWETALGSTVAIPAHIVAQRSGLKDVDALVSLLGTVPKGVPSAPGRPNTELKKVSDFWNTGFDSKSMPDPSLALSNGPFLVKSVEPSKEAILTRNDDYTWGKKPKLDNITVAYASTSALAIDALEGGKADVVSPVADQTNLTRLQGLKSKGVETMAGQSLGFDQLVINFKGVLSKADYRTALMKSVPRKEIVEALVKPFDDKAEPLNSLMFRPVQTPYKESAASNGSKDFAEVDIAEAQKLLGEAKPSVRILYNKEDPNRLKEFQLISASITQAGFTVIDSGLPAKGWQSALTAGAFDIALYGWMANATGSAQVPNVFKTGADSNLNNFSNTVVDQLTNQLASDPDDAKQNALKMQIDKLAFEAGYGLPLFAVPGLVARSKHVTDISYSPVEIGVWWNVADWGYKK